MQEGRQPAVRRVPQCWDRLRLVFHQLDPASGIVATIVALATAIFFVATCAMLRCKDAQAWDVRVWCRLGQVRLRCFSNL